MELPFLVDRTGIEPATSPMPWVRATNCANGPFSSAIVAYLSVLFKIERERRSIDPRSAVFIGRDLPEDEMKLRSSTQRQCPEMDQIP